MVLQKKDHKMASEQPVKKKLRRTDEDHTSDEPDFIHGNMPENGVQALHISLSPTVNEADITLNAVNQHITSKIAARTSDSEVQNFERTNSLIECVDPSIKPAPDIFSSATFTQPFLDSYLSSSISNTQGNSLITNHDRDNYIPHSIQSPSFVGNNHNKENNPCFAIITSDSKDFLNIPLNTDVDESFDVFQNYLIRQCLCGISEGTLRKPFEGQQITDMTGTRTATLIEWPIPKILEFLSKLQLLFEVYLKQNNKGFICARVVDVCNSIVSNEYNLIEQIISLCDTRNKYVNYLSAKVLSSLLIIAKTNINNEWLESIMNFLTMDSIDYIKINFSLEVIKRVVEWKDIEIHVLEEPQSDGPSTSSQRNNTCTTIQFSDPDSYDTSAIKGLMIKSLETKWGDLINRMQNMILHNDCVDAQTCILTFLALWESIISVKANLSVIDTKPFYAHLEIFVSILHSNLPTLIWKQILSLFNEVLCYGSTLALQDLLPEDTCQLAHLIVRYVKDYRLLDSLPYRRSDGYHVNSFVGAIQTSQPNHTSTDKTLLQKMSLLVLKSVAITIKETRSDSSDSSVGSDDYDFYHDMQLIERSIRDVLKKVDVFLKNSLDFHPETPFSKILVHLLSDQDDYMIESMVCTLDITIGISYRNAVFPDLISMLNPTFSFIEFLKVVSHDSGVLLDYLVSNETCFLLYLLRFLKYTRRNWPDFVASCCDNTSGTRSNELDNTMTVLIRLKMQIKRLVSKELFPYNISPVLRLLEVCEELYEGNEYS